MDNGQLRAGSRGPWQSSTSKSSTSTLLLYDCGIRAVAFVNEYFGHVPYD